MRTLAALVCILAFGALHATPFRRGDVNGDGFLDLSDPVAELLYLFSNRDIACEDAADVNDDGAIGIDDAIFSLNYLFLRGLQPPAPGAIDCGVDPTEDELGCTFYRPAREALRCLVDEPPIAVISASAYRGEVPLEVRLDGRSSSDPDGIIAGYRWVLGDGETASGPVVTHEYDRSGAFEVELTVTDDGGNEARRSTVIVVTEPRPSRIVRTSPLPLETGVAVTGGSDFGASSLISGEMSYGWEGLRAGSGLWSHLWRDELPAG